LFQAPYFAARHTQLVLQCWLVLTVGLLANETLKNIKKCDRSRHVRTFAVDTYKKAMKIRFLQMSLGAIKLIES
jgi:hypothetical protein